jgi:hypothetical protein
MVNGTIGAEMMEAEDAVAAVSDALGSTVKAPNGRQKGRSRRAPKASAADEALANAAKQKRKSRLDQLEDEDDGDVRCI